MGTILFPLMKPLSSTSVFIFDLWTILSKSMNFHAFRGVRFLLGVKDLANRGGRSCAPPRCLSYSREKCDAQHRASRRTYWPVTCQLHPIALYHTKTILDQTVIKHETSWNINQHWVPNSPTALQPSPAYGGQRLCLLLEWHVSAQTSRPCWKHFGAQPSARKHLGGPKERPSNGLRGTEYIFFSSWEGPENSNIEHN